MSAPGTKRTFLPSAFLMSSVHPVFQHQARHPIKLSHIIRHQNRTGGNGVPGDSRVVRADWRPGEAQRDLYIRGRINRGETLGPVAPKHISE